MLAGISVEYYTRLERGNAAASPKTCSKALARPCSSTRPSATHLFDCSHCGRRPRRPPRRTASQARVRPVVQRILDSMPDAGLRAQRTPRRPGRQPPRRALYSPLYDQADAGTRQHRPVHFLDPARQSFFVDWESIANDYRRVSCAPRPAATRTTSELLRPHRRAVHPERRVPMPLGRPRRPSTTAPGIKRLPPPRRRRPHARLRSLRAPRRRRADGSSSTAPNPAPPSAEALDLLASWTARARHALPTSKNRT